MLIDEISLMRIDLLTALEQFRLKGVRLVALSDFQKLARVCSRWRGQKAPPDLFGITPGLPATASSCTGAAAMTRGT